MIVRRRHSWVRLALASILGLGVAVPAAAAETEWTSILGMQSAPHRLGFHPTDPDRIFVGSWGWGLFRTSNGGLTWSNDTVSFTTPSGPNRFYVFQAFFSPSDPSRGIAITADGTFTTTTAGVTWSLHPANASGGCPYTGYEIVLLPDGSGVAISELGTGPTGGILWFYDWGSNTFSVGTAIEPLSLKPYTSVLGLDFGVDGGLHFGHTVEAYWTDDLGETLVRNSLGLPDHNERTIVADPLVAGRVLAAVDGGLFRQSAVGEDWIPWGIGLPSPTRKLLHHPLASDVLFAATNSGVYRSNDRGSSWQPMTVAGMDFSIIADVAIHPEAPHLLYASGMNETRSLGEVYRIEIDVATGVESLGPANLALELRNAPNPFDARTEIAFALAREGHVRLDVFDVAGRRVSRIVDRRLPAGAHAIPWNGRDGADRRLGGGVYFYRLDLDGLPVGRDRLVIRR